MTAPRPADGLSAARGDGAPVSQSLDSKPSRSVLRRPWASGSG